MQNENGKNSAEGGSASGGKIASSAALSASVTVALITLVTIIADLNPPLKDWLKSTFSHHWIGKGVLAAAIFIVLTFLFRLMSLKTDAAGLSRKLAGLFWVGVLGALAIFGFYFYEAFLVG